MAQRLKVGDPAPDFTARTHDRHEIRLSQFRGQKVVVLYFYPRDETTICTRQACAFRDAYEDFVAAGAVVIGVSGDSAASHEAFAANHRLPFLLLSDEDGAIRRTFGVPKTFGLLPGRVTYVIDRAGTIRLIFDSALSAQRHVTEALAIVRHPETPPPKRRGWLRLPTIGALLVALVGFAWFYMIRMPGRPFVGPLPALNAQQTSLPERLRRDVTELAVTIGPRNLDHYPALQSAARFLANELADAGYEVTKQTFVAHGRECENLEATRLGSGRPDEIVLLVAHYDSFHRTPGANDNASGTAGLLALSRRFSSAMPQRTLRFVAVTNEEPPHFQRETMGSWAYAKRCRERNENLVAVISLETIGYFSTAPGSQQYPALMGAFYPDTADFIAVVGNVGSRPLVHQVVESFRRQADFPCHGGAVPGMIPGVGWSDHWSFWQEGYQAVMFTDTAPFRYRHYHEPTDTPDQLDFERMARVVDGVAKVVEELANPR